MLNTGAAVVGDNPGPRPGAVGPFVFEGNVPGGELLPFEVGPRGVWPGADAVPGAEPLPPAPLRAKPMPPTWPLARATLTSLARSATPLWNSGTNRYAAAIAAQTITEITSMYSVAV